MHSQNSECLKPWNCPVSCLYHLFLAVVVNASFLFLSVRALSLDSLARLTPAKTKRYKRPVDVGTNSCKVDGSAMPLGGALEQDLERLLSRWFFKGNE